DAAPNISGKPQRIAEPDKGPESQPHVEEEDDHPPNRERWTSPRPALVPRHPTGRGGLLFAIMLRVLEGGCFPEVAGAVPRLPIPELRPGDVGFDATVSSMRAAP
ncbi:MAG: hypothetical protein QOH68_3962, partial [Nocardioidaceae bacterium]|nr:hypothetical protein [Nocardioidaceae bacterium]